MEQYDFIKVIAVKTGTSIYECGEMLCDDNSCLAVNDKEGNFISYVRKETLSEALNLGIGEYPIDLISMPASISELEDAKELKKYIDSPLNIAVLIGNDKKEINGLISLKAPLINNKEIYLTREYNKILPDKIKKILSLISHMADKLAISVFLVGGVVRDLIKGIKSLDIDITVEANAIEFSRQLRKEYPDKVTLKEIHDDFKTTKLIFNIDGENIELDIASTRKEGYPYPASLPKLCETGVNIKDDLSRRDFTINSMALSLNKASFCRLIDPLNGYSDIEKKKIKIIHPLSFVEDPTRIIRALKFSVRFDYELDNTTDFLANKCVESGLFDNLGGERLKAAIKQTFNLNKKECFKEFISKKLYKMVDKEISSPENPSSLGSRICDITKKYNRCLSSQDYIWLIYFGAMLVNSQNISGISERMLLSGVETGILIGAKEIIKNHELLKSAQKRFEIYELLEGYLNESVLIALIAIDDRAIEKKLDLYLREIQHVKIFTTGKILIERGLTPGPLFGSILRELLREKINGKICTKKDEELYLNKIFPDKKSGK